ncbi:Zn-dependent peptidase ImmA (M78 family)/transcriptional regulator with XRE-family HTH domain [Paenibacillus peoriae]|uniref:Zn-dependent peptidase ImmA (M78 family)/transcriptional regulator with XRE-family HTH domain n=1 Tax=Paenibacillus peoriae TaxID=59893 RepID=A0ABU1QBK9_9BACL|nr:XRE family transcriptional regulator [Paenibacillus peoriae]MDR6776240.1 Zn-dependent peptidase ImmA (M78 family)/transcriptional regulator with XRE-family HTH domain [Paenibacillus peoriae]
MQLTNSVNYNSQLVVLGRESRSISQSELAKKIGFTQGKLSKIENGLISITQEELDKISKALNYPNNFFQREEKIYGIGLSEFFHRKKQAVPQRQLNTVYARLELRRMEIQTLLRSVDIDEPTFFHMDPEKYDGDVEKIAQIVRATFRIPNGPIQNVIDVLEDAGAIVIPFDFEDANIDAIHLWNPGVPPLIFTNFNRTMDRIRFTLCHELGHIIMHRKPPSEDVDIEEQADRFSSEFLMPKNEISHSLGGITLPKLAALKPYWKVSMNALLKRAVDLNKITERQSRYLWTQMGKSGYRTREPIELDLPFEKPSMLEEILQIHQSDLSYSYKDLSNVTSLTEAEFQNIYSVGKPRIRLIK